MQYVNNEQTIEAQSFLPTDIQAEAANPVSDNLKTEMRDRKWDGSFLFVCWVYLGVLVCFSVLRIMFGMGWMNSLPNWGAEVFFTFMAQIVIMTLIPLIAMHIFFRRRKQNAAQANGYVSYEDRDTYKETFASFGFDKPSGRVIAIAFGLGALCYLFNIFVASFFTGMLSLLGYRFPMGGVGGTFAGLPGLLLSLVMIAVLPGFCEEVTHRGMLMKSFNSRLGIMKSIFITSILFGFMHLNVVQVFYAAILGYLIALATVATKSLWVGVILHFMNNALATYFSFATSYGWIGSGILDILVDVLAMPFGIFIYVALVYGVYRTIMFIIHMFARESYSKNKKAHFAHLLKENPSLIGVMNDGAIPMEELIAKVEGNVAGLSRWRQTKFFIDPSSIGARKKANFTPAEAAAYYGILFLGAIITTFTLVWGLL